MRTRITIETDGPCLVAIVPLDTPSRPGPRKIHIVSSSDEFSDPSPSSSCFRAAAPVLQLRKSA